MRLRHPVYLLVLAAGLGLASCGDDPASTPASPAQPTSGQGQTPSAERLDPARCPAELAGCKEASGRILFVEAVDPDGDGDAHFVLASADSVTAPGISVVDVRRDLRPRPLPEVGEQLSAAGPVLPGSYGQRQIEAIELGLAR